MPDNRFKGGYVLFTGHIPTHTQPWLQLCIMKKQSQTAMEKLLTTISGKDLKGGIDENNFSTFIRNNDAVTNTVDDLFISPLDDLLPSSHEVERHDDILNEALQHDNNVVEDEPEKEHVK